MGKLQITTAEIKTRILRVCHVKKNDCESREKPVSYVCVMCPIRPIHVSNGLPTIAIVMIRSAAESWTDKKGCTTLLYTVSCVAVAASPTRRSLLTKTANNDQLLMARQCCTLFHRRSYGLILATFCGLDYWFAYYRSITIVQSDTGKYHELVAPYYYECAARVIIP